MSANRQTVLKGKLATVPKVIKKTQCHILTLPNWMRTPNKPTTPELSVLTQSHRSSLMAMNLLSTTARTSMGLGKLEASWLRRIPKVDNFVKTRHAPSVFAHKHGCLWGFYKGWVMLYATPSSPKAVAIHDGISWGPVSRKSALTLASEYFPVLVVLIETKNTKPVPHDWWILSRSFSILRSHAQINPMKFNTGSKINSSASPLLWVWSRGCESRSLGSIRTVCNVLHSFVMENIDFLSLSTPWSDPTLHTNASRIPIAPLFPGGVSASAQAFSVYQVEHVLWHVKMVKWAKSQGGWPLHGCTLEITWVYLWYNGSLFQSLKMYHIYILLSSVIVIYMCIDQAEGSAQEQYLPENLIRAEVANIFSQRSHWPSQCSLQTCSRDSAPFLKTSIPCWSCWTISKMRTKCYVFEYVNGSLANRPKCSCLFFRWGLEGLTLLVQQYSFNYSRLVFHMTALSSTKSPSLFFATP